METLLKTPLHTQHLSLNAKMVPFGGWDMPVQYQSILQEYEQTRKSAAIFDICHMGEFEIVGDPRETGLDHLVTQNLVDMPLKTCRYGMILNEQAGVLDDLIVFRTDTQKWFLVVNASTKDKDFHHLKTNLKYPNCLTDVSAQTGKIDLQGPLSRDVLMRLIPDVGKLAYYAFDFFSLLGEEKILVSRTGYTGELGYEIYFPASKIAKLWQVLLEDKRVAPAGLGARDILRLEMGYSLYGHELSDIKNPVESGLTRFIDFDKNFMGKTALCKIQAQGVEVKIAGIISADRRSPREGQTVYASDETPIGVISSGCFSPAMGRGIAMGFLRSDFCEPGHAVYFGDDKRKNPAQTVSRFFYKGGSLKN